MPKPLDRQVGGTHYKGLAIEPVELAYANQYDDCIFSALKYLMRHHLKAGGPDLDKAEHFCHIRADLMTTFGPPPKAVEIIPILRMAFANKMPEPEKEVAVALHEWACHRLTGPNGEIAAEIGYRIRQIRETRYPEKG